MELRVPEGITALLFDLDGVLTQTSKVHFAAWKEMFDAFLREHEGAEFTEQDYAAYVDGKPRLDGVRSFLEARGIEPDAELVEQLGTRKNDLVLRLIEEQGVERYDGSIAFVEAARERGYPWAWLSTPAGNARARRFYERREWRADSLVEVHYGMPWASYGRSLLPPRGGPGHNRPVDAGVGSRP
ncbi:MAG: HAD family hydrolase [Anaeromyxobacteraceae bacterium]